MMKDMKWRLIIIAAVIGLSVWSFYPPGEKVRLGLDLKGGVYLVLRVKTDDALQLETETTVERLRDTLTRASVQYTKVEVVSPTEFRVEGVQNDAAFRDAAVDADTSFDRSSEPNGYSYRLKPNIANQLRDGAVTQSLETIERRVNELGVAEPIVARYGGQDQIVVQLPGVSDVRRAKEIIRSTAQLKLTLVDQGPFPNREAALQAFSNTVPPDVEILPGRQEGGGTAGTAGTVFYAVKRAAAVTGRDLRNAQQSLDEFNRPALQFTLETGCRGAIRELHADQHRTSHGDRARQPRDVGGDDSGADHRQRSDHGHQPGRDDRHGNHPEVRRAAGDAWSISRSARWDPRWARTRFAPG